MEGNPNGELMETYSGWLGPLEGLELTGEAEIDNLDKE